VRPEGLSLGLGGIAFLIGAWLALRGILASREKLMEMAKVIGTENLILARIICCMGFIPLGVTGFGLLVLGSLIACGVVE
jgi:hypothetical protein